MPQEETKLRDGRIVRSESPLNLEMPFSTVDSFITPAKSFYVRTHFPIPTIDRNAWWLHVDGELEKPFAIDYEELMTLGSVTIAATLECAGNNRNFLEPKVKGVQWRLGAVGTAEWTGVPLSVLLDRAILKSNASEVVLEGADSGILEDPKSPPGELKFARSIPLEKARRDVLLAYKMNDVEIPLIHGRPLRLIVPGWEAAGSCKWLTSIHVGPEEAAGFFMQTAYRIPNRNVAPGSAVDPKDMIPYTALDVKSIFTAPLEDATFKLGSPIELRGFAWAGEADITRVDISTDFGRTWVAAELGSEKAKYAWRRFRYSFRPSKAGSYMLLARAAERLGIGMDAVTPAEAAGQAMSGAGRSVASLRGTC